MYVRRSNNLLVLFLAFLLGVLFLSGCVKEEIRGDVYIYRTSVWVPVALLLSGMMPLSLCLFVKLGLRRHFRPFNWFGVIFAILLCTGLASPLFFYRVEVGDNGIHKDLDLWAGE